MVLLATSSARSSPRPQPRAALVNPNDVVGTSQPLSVGSVAPRRRSVRFRRFTRPMCETWLPRIPPSRALRGRRRGDGWKHRIALPRHNAHETSLFLAAEDAELSGDRGKGTGRVSCVRRLAVEGAGKGDQGCWERERERSGCVDSAPGSRWRTRCRRAPPLDPLHPENLGFVFCEIRLSRHGSQHRSIDRPVTRTRILPTAVPSSIDGS